jgi:RHS repeat-associated protein
MAISPGPNDAVGNRTNQSLAGGGFSELYSYATDSNRLLSVARGADTRGFTYLPSGQVSRDQRNASQDFTLGYDAAGRFKQLDNLASPVATYQHNALGQRVLKTLPANRAFHFDQDGALLQEYTTPVTATPVAHIWLGDLPLAVEQSGNLYYTHPDHRGATLRITDNAQALKWDAILTPFGETNSLPAQALAYNPRLPGQFVDTEGNTGWHYNYFRTYEPAVGRYMQSDPIGLRGGLNTYAYVRGSPIMLIDPFGLADGHHFVTGPIRDDPNLSEPARKVFRNAKTGRLPEPHLYDRDHRLYNQGVWELYQKFLRENKTTPATMTEEQANRFVQQVKQCPDPRIRNFLNRIYTSIMRNAMRGVRRSD